MPPELEREYPEAGDVEDVPRPREQSAFVGHEAAQTAFLEAMQAARLHHAWLIGGPRGIGKATLAYRMARRLIAGSSGDDLDMPAGHPVMRQVAALSHPNLVALRRVQAPGAKTLPTKISVDAARKALELFGATAGNDGYRVCVVDSAEDLNAASANALLKMVEEPPARSIFLIVSHAPGRLLPTIRSRCRVLALRPLAEPQVRAVIERFPAPFARPDPSALARAAALSEGSVARALTMLDPAVVKLIEEVEALLAAARDPDWRRIMKVAERVAGRDAEPLFATALDTVLRFVSAELERRKGEGAARLVHLVEAADNAVAAARDAATYNLDRRPVVLSMFGEISEAMKAV